MGGTADWGALWPASAAVWQFGNLVPLHVTLPGDYLAARASTRERHPSCSPSLRSRSRASRRSSPRARACAHPRRTHGSRAWSRGRWASPRSTTLIALTSGGSTRRRCERWQAILFPALVYAIPLLVGAVVTEWREAGAGFVARVRDRVEATPHGWGEVPGLIVRGTAVVLAGLIGLGALAFAVALVLRGGEVIALFEAAHVDALGATVITLAQLAYLPTLVIWGMAFVAGPGFAVGAGHRGLAGRDAARRDPRHPRPRRAAGVHDALAAAARAAAGGARRARGVDRALAARGAAGPRGCRAARCRPDRMGCRTRGRPQHGADGAACRGGHDADRANRMPGPRARPPSRRSRRPDRRADRSSHSASRCCRPRAPRCCACSRRGRSAPGGSPRSARSRARSRSRSGSRCCSAPRSCCCRRGARRRPRSMRASGDPRPPAPPPSTRDAGRSRRPTRIAGDSTRRSEADHRRTIALVAGPVVSAPPVARPGRPRQHRRPPTSVPAGRKPLPPVD